MNDRGGVDRLFGELESARGGTMRTITDRVSDLTGLRIEIDLLGERDWARVARVMLVKDDHARIPLRKSDPRWYRLHVVTHELAHLLCGHSECATLPMTFEDLQRSDRALALSQESAAWGALSPDEAREHEAEAEELSRRLSGLVLVPRYADAEALFH